jgi:hypothetical protein
MAIPAAEYLRMSTEHQQQEVVNAVRARMKTAAWLNVKCVRSTP